MQKLTPTIYRVPQKGIRSIHSIHSFDSIQNNAWYACDAFDPFKNRGREYKSKRSEAKGFVRHMGVTDFLYFYRFFVFVFQEHVMHGLPITRTKQKFSSLINHHFLMSKLRNERTIYIDLHSPQNP
jgi:hypothetical protein